MCRQLPDGAEVGLLHPLGGSGELQILVHALAKRGAHEWVFSKRGRKTRLETYPAGQRLTQTERLSNLATLYWRKSRKVQ